MARLRRAHPDRPGWTRRRRGRGWQYLDEKGRPVTDPDQLSRIRSLVIPPAWQDVWISPHANGHIQAVGTDDAGRRQYRYHDDWTTSRSKAKFERIISFGAALPRARRQFAADLVREELHRDSVLAVAAMLLDAGYFRIGNATYAERHGSVGLSTLRRRHVRQDGTAWEFRYVAKSGVKHVERISEPDLVAAIALLMARRSGPPPELLAYRDGRRFRALVGSDINAYLKQTLAESYSAKDFRTWRGTVLAAVALALTDLDDPPAKPRTQTANRRAVREAVVDVSRRLGNTPTVCRSSYIDPRVIEEFEKGVTVKGSVRRHRRSVADAEDELAALSRIPAVEKAVLALLRR